MNVYTPCAEVNEVLDGTLARLQEIFAEGLLGLYLYGSLITGDFDRAVSDIDLLSVVDREMDESRYDAVQRLHDRLALDYPAWAGRIEVQYWSRETIQCFLHEPRQLAVISPGEPFHRKEADPEYQLNLWIVREQSQTVFGAPPETLIDEIPPAVYRSILHEHINYYVEHIRDETGKRWQSYVRLTLCRALYSLQFGVQASKRQSAQWVVEQWSDWTAVVEDALAWRSSKNVDDVASSTGVEETLCFVEFIVAQSEKL